MSFPRYPAYKPSGVEWLPVIPTGWEISRLKQFCTVFPSNVDKKSVEGETPVKLCNYTDVYYNDSICAEMEFMDATASEEQVRKFALRAGDVIITKDSETADDIAIAAYVPETLPGVICGYHLSMIRPRGGVSGAYVKRIFDSIYAKSLFAVKANGLTRVGLSQYAVDNVELPLPPSHEQVAIATFLDHETANIDALIAEQQRLIELLQEKRQAVISHAVTKGLNPDAPMKDSGVEWLGEVPEHWDAAKMKHRFRTTSGSTPNSEALDVYYTTDDDDEAIPWIRTTDINNDEVNVAEVFITPKAIVDTACSVLPVNTVLVALYGGAGTVGKNGILKIDAAVNQALCAILPSRNALPEYVHAYVQFLRPFWMERAVSARKAGNISQELARDTLFPLPAIEEQQAILYGLNKHLREIDLLESESTASLVLLEERRSALISAAVTGQIDVRGLVPEASAA